jgi:hypothetical protein
MTQPECAQLLGEFRKVVSVMKGARNSPSHVMCVWADDMKAAEDVEAFLESAVNRSAQFEEMVRALQFYADPKRYQGANQRNDANDPYSGDAPYIKDVGRDSGAIARTALSTLRAST